MDNQQKIHNPRPILSLLVGISVGEREKTLRVRGFMERNDPAFQEPELPEERWYSGGLENRGEQNQKKSEEG